MMLRVAFLAMFLCLSPIASLADGPVSPFESAIKHQSWDEVRELIRGGENLKVHVQGEFSLVHVFSMIESEADILEMLLDQLDTEYLVSINKPVSPLHIAAKTGNTTAISLLLEAGFEVNIKADNGDTPLFYALIGKSPLNTTKVLIKAGANVNVANNQGYTPVHIAATNPRDITPLLILLEKGAKANVKADDGVTPMLLAQQRGHLGAPALLDSYSGNDAESNTDQYGRLGAADASSANSKGRNLNAERTALTKESVKGMLLFGKQDPESLKNMIAARKGLESALTLRDFHGYGDGVQEAVQVVHEAIERFEPDTEIRELVLRYYLEQISVLLSNHGATKLAIEFDRMHLDFCREHFADTHLAIFIAKLNLGLDLYMDRNYKESRQYLEDVVIFLEEYKAYNMDDIMARIYGYYADLLYEIGSFEKAQENVNRSLSIFNAHSVDGTIAFEPRVLKARMLADAGQYSRAYKILDTVIKSTGQAAHYGIVDQGYMIASAAKLDVMLNSGDVTDAGVFATYLYDKLQALSRLAQEREVIAEKSPFPVEKVTVWRGGLSHPASKLHGSIARTFFVNNEFKKAETILDLMPFDTDEKRYLKSKLLEKLGLNDEAFEIHAKSVEVIQALKGSAHPSIAAHRLRMAILHEKAARFEEAMSEFRSVIRILLAGKYAPATAWQKYPAIELDTTESHLIKEAISGIHRMRAEDISGTDDLLDLEMLASDRLRSSVNLGSSISLLTALADLPGDAGELLSMKKALEIERVLVERRLDEEFTSSVTGRGSGISESVRSDLALVLQKIDDVNDTLYADHPFVMNLIDGRSVEVNESRSVLHDDEAIIMYVMLDKGMHVCTLTPSIGRCEIFDSDTTELKRTIKALRSSMSIRSDGVRGELPVFSTDSSARLYDALLRPVLSGLSEAGKLFIVTDEELQSLPFSLLISSSGKGENPAEYSWLIKQYNVSRLPSASTLYHLRSRDDSSSGIRDNIFALSAGRGKPISIDEIPSSARLKLEFIYKLPELPDAEREVVEITSIYSPDSRVVLKDNAATERNLKSINLGSFSTILFATHALLPGEIFPGSEASIVLTPEFKGDALDGLLTASEIAGTKLSSRMVVLSACNTARVDTAVDTPGLASLSNAFLYAGAQSVVATHWPVETESAAEYTTTMFKLLREDENMSVADATAAVARRFIKGDAGEQYTHPFYWAAFEAIGLSH